MPCCIKNDNKHLPSLSHIHTHANYWCQQYFAWKKSTFPHNISRSQSHRTKLPLYLRFEVSTQRHTIQFCSVNSLECRIFNLLMGDCLSSTWYNILKRALYNMIASAIWQPYRPTLSYNFYFFFCTSISFLLHLVWRGIGIFKVLDIVNYEVPLSFNQVSVIHGRSNNPFPCILWNIPVHHFINLLHFLS